MATYRFDEFELDPETRQLRRQGELLRLERRPFDLLALLVSSPNRLHSRDEIVAGLWPEKVIIDFDAGLNTLVRKVRHVLGDSPDTPRFIETVPGVGYRFVAPVSVSAVTAPAESEGAAPGRPRGARWRSHYALAALLAVGLGAALLVKFSLRDEAPPGTIRIAVLPFENLSGDSELSYLASGLAEETSLSLSRIDLPELVVIGGVTARALAKVDTPPERLVDEFDIDYVVDSSLRVEGSRLRVTSRLTRTADAEQIWSESFDREMTNVLSLQRELSIAIAEQIRQRLSPDVAARIARRQTQNPAAYELYLKGREQWTLFKPTLVDDAIAYYEQAVAIDPEYGLAWAGIAHAATTAPMTADSPPQTMQPQARHALKQALRYGGDLAETYVAEAAYDLFIEWDYAGAESAARHASELDPNNAMARNTRAIALSAMGRSVEARAEMERARQLDPLFPLMFANSGYVERTAGNPEAGVEYTRQAIAINPDFWVGHYQLSLVLLHQHDYDAALAAMDDAHRLSGGNKAMTIGYRSYLLACLGRTDEARELRDLLVDRAQERYVSSYMIAVAEAGLGNADSAFEWLGRAAAEHDIGLSGYTVPATGISPDDPQFAWFAQPCGETQEQML